jgi:hypothetical protein
LRRKRNPLKSFDGNRLRRKRKRATRFRSRAIDLMSVTNGHDGVKENLSTPCVRARTTFPLWNGGVSHLARFKTRPLRMRRADERPSGQQLEKKGGLKTRIARPPWVPRD